MSREALKVTIYAWPERDADEGEVWVAECVTLNLVSRRSDFDAVMDAMVEQIEGYLETVSLSAASGLVPRRSPLRRRMRYWLTYQASKALPGPDHPMYRQERPISCPV